MKNLLKKYPTIQTLTNKLPLFFSPPFSSTFSPFSSCSKSQSTPSPSSSFLPVSQSPVPFDTLLAQIKSNPEFSSSNLALQDTHGRFHSYLRISLTERCNLRCLYCMPEEGVQLTPNDKLLTTQEINRLVDIFVSHGVNKIRFTGGEPLVRKDIEDIIKNTNKHKQIQSIGITTNGIVLSRKLASLVSSGLNHINISLDTLDPLKFNLITRRQGHDRVIESIENSLNLLKENKIKCLKVNCVIMKGLNHEEIHDFVEFTKDKDLEVRFIEYMPFDGNRWSDKKFYSYSDMIKLIKSKYPTLERLPDSSPNETSKVWHIPGFKGRLGFISSMTDNFCSTCNRVRLTADGNLKVCLFGPQEVSLRDAMRDGRTDEEIGLIIKAAVSKKKARHAGMFEIAKSKNRPMITIGGRSQLKNNYNKNKMNMKSNVRMNSNYSISSQNIFSTSPLSHFSTKPANSTSNSGLSHISFDGLPTMVDVGDKNITQREAVAEGFIYLPESIANIWDQNDKEIKSAKGPVITTAIIAGTQGVKMTSQLIPFCHPLIIDKIKFNVYPIKKNKNSLTLRIECTVKCTGKTGVEMEALSGVSICALTIYDMCKALSHDIKIDYIQLIKKTGGKQDVKKFT